MRIERHISQPVKAARKAAPQASTRSLDETRRSPERSRDSKDVLVWNETEYQSLRREATRAADEGSVPLILAADNRDELNALTEAVKSFQGTEDTQELPLVNGVATWVQSRSLKRFLTTLPTGSNVFVDRPLHLEKKDVPNHIFMEAANVEVSPTETSAKRLPGLSKVWEQGFRGQGQTIAVIDSGMFPHADLKDQVAVWKDFSDDKPKMVDPFGHGTHVQGIIAGNGNKSDGKITGVAPEAKLAALRIGSVGDAIKALQWVVDNKEKYNISVVNLSLGDKATKPWAQDPWAMAVKKAIDEGLVVVVAAGNNGPISTPGTLPEAITVGAVDDKGTPAPEDDVLASFSGRGPTIDGLKKPDLLAPGVGIYSTLSPGSSVDVASLPHIKKDYIAISGTSQAAPMVAGLAALLKQARPELTPAQVREALMSSAHHYPSIPDKDQGAGLVQADRALEAALAA